MMGNNVACLMSDHQTRGVLTSAERPSPQAARLSRALRDPLFPRKVAKAAACLRAMPTARARRLAADFADALDAAERGAEPLPQILADRGLLSRIPG